MAQAGADSPHLDERQQKQAADRAQPGPIVIHEIVREQGEVELDRSFSGLAWSGLAAGMSIGFSFITQAALQAALPETPWRRLVAGFGYSLGFLITVLGQQQLFTETTLTALIPALTRRDVTTLLRTLRVWVIVLLANLLGTLVFAAILILPGIFRPETIAAMIDLSAHLLEQGFWQALVGACFSGWLIGLMVWLLPASGSARPFTIVLLTYAIALFGFPHIVAGSVEAAFGVFTGHATAGDYMTRFLAPTLIGNILGGSALAALLNHAPVADELVEKA